MYTSFKPILFIIELSGILGHKSLFHKFVEILTITYYEEFNFNCYHVLNQICFNKCFKKRFIYYKTKLLKIEKNL